MKKYLSTLLDELSATDKGSYFLVRCPKCGEKEGFLYKDQLKRVQDGTSHKVFVHCSRLNNCGETSVFSDIYWDELNNRKNFTEVEDTSNYPKEPALSRLASLVSLNANLFGLDSFAPWRGISKDVLVANGICYLDKSKFPKGWLTWMQQTASSYPQEHLGKEYLYANRDIVIPFVNEEGVVDRVLLRSSWDKRLNPQIKELTYKLTPKSIPIWNRKDAFGEGNILFITEGVVDALSIKEARPTANVVALPGVGQWKHFVKYANQINLKKKVVICFDNDKAGVTCRNGLARSLKISNVWSESFDLHSFNDCNDFLNGNRELFIQTVNSFFAPKKKFLLNIDAIKK